MADLSDRSNSRRENPSLKPNNARSVKPRTNSCITTTARSILNYAARSARRPLMPTIVTRNPRKPNITARIAAEPYSAGKPASTLLCTNVATKIAHTDSTPLSNSRQQNTISVDQNLHSSNFATFTVNIYSRPKTWLSPHHSNPPSIFERSITHPMFSG